MKHLKNSNLENLPKSVMIGNYNRANIKTGVVHFGAGAFHRAHQAYYFDKILEDDNRWGICEIALNSQDVRNKLAPDIWSPDKKLFPHIKRQVLKGLYSFLKPENIKSIYIVGTIAGYQYSDSSDIDVNIEVNPPELVDSPELKAKRKAADGDKVPGTDHVINYFFILKIYSHFFYFFF